MRTHQFIAHFSLLLLFLNGCGGGNSASPAPTYTVGGTVSGLSASGLVLRNNGSGDLTINANGSFTIANAVASGTAYDVTVQDQPLGFTDACAISNGSGVVAQANVTAVLVSCHQATAEVSLLAGSPLGALNIKGEAVDPSGNLYFMNVAQNEILKVAPTGIVSVYAGGPLVGAGYSAGLLAGLSRAGGFAVDAAGNIYVADAIDNEIRKISPTGIVTTLAGSTAAGNADGVGSAASFNSPEGIAVDNAGAIYVADTGNYEIRGITPSGAVTTIAGSPTPGTTDGTGTAASFTAPTEIFVGLAGAVYVADAFVVRAITAAGVVTTRAGPYYQVDLGTCMPTLCSGGYASITAMVVDAAGNIYVAVDVTPFGPPEPLSGTVIWVTAPAGNQHFIAGAETVPVPADGTGTTAGFGLVEALVADPAGVLYAVDTGYGGVYSGSIRSIDHAGVVTTPSETWNAGNKDGTGAAATFASPVAVATDAAGNVYVADSQFATPVGLKTNNEIRKITPAGAVTTLAGSAAAGNADGTGSAARFNLPYGIAVDAAGDIFVADSANYEIRKITPAGTVTTLAGSATPGNADGTGAAASFNNPSGIAIDAAGDIYVADSANNEIRKITPTGAVTTLAGSATPGNADGAGSAASFNQPSAIAVDAAGDIYVADSANNEIRKITPTGAVTTLAGSATPGNADGAGSAASFSRPSGIAVDAAGDIYVADSANNVIRKITPAGAVTTLAGSATAGNADGAGSAANFDNPTGVAADRAGNLYVADLDNKGIRRISPQ